MNSGLERAIRLLRAVFEIDLRVQRGSPTPFVSGWPECVTPVIVMSFSLTMRYSCCALPAFLWVMVASGRCFPVAHACMSSGDALSIR